MLNKNFKQLLLRFILGEHVLRQNNNLSLNFGKFHGKFFEKKGLCVDFLNDGLAAYVKSWCL